MGGAWAGRQMQPLWREAERRKSPAKPAVDDDFPTYVFCLLACSLFVFVFRVRLTSGK